MTTSSDITLDELFAATNARPKTAFGYIRASSLREKRKQQGDITTETQTDYIRSFAQREGIDIVGWIPDLNISGRREKFLSRKIMPAIERIKAGEAEAVIVYNVSRWGRSSVDHADGRQSADHLHGDSARSRQRIRRRKDHRQYRVDPEVPAGCAGTGDHRRRVAAVSRQAQRFRTARPSDATEAGAPGDRAVWCVSDAIGP